MKTCVSFLLFATTGISLSAQAFQTLDSFNSTDGSYPNAGVVLGTDGNLYGATYMGGTAGYGTVFQLTPSGTLTTIHSFAASEGHFPVGMLAMSSNGEFYGVTSSGGTAGLGTVFQITTSGTLTTLYNFGSHSGDGAYPAAGLTLATNGNFFGTTQYGGAGGMGTVFTVTPSGGFDTLHSFCAQKGCYDGAEPQAPLLQDSDGNLYGTTFGYPGTSTGYGTVFQITTAGKLITLKIFNGSDGSGPFGQLVQVGNGLYGTTYLGGTTGFGTVFRMNPAGALTRLYNFCSQAGCADGSGPVAGLIYATDGNLYGTTYNGGSNNGGTAFKLTLGGAISTLYNFPAQGNPEGTLFEYTNGTLYGTTQIGGTSDDGTIFTLSVGLTPDGESANVQ